MSLRVSLLCMNETRELGGITKKEDYIWVL